MMDPADMEWLEGFVKKLEDASERARNRPDEERRPMAATVLMAKAGTARFILERLRGHTDQGGT